MVMNNKDKTKEVHPILQKIIKKIMNYNHNLSDFKKKLIDFFPIENEIYNKIKNDPSINKLYDLLYGAILDLPLPFYGLNLYDPKIFVIGINPSASSDSLSGMMDWYNCNKYPIHQNDKEKIQNYISVITGKAVNHKYIKNFPSRNRLHPELKELLFVDLFHFPTITGWTKLPNPKGLKNTFLDHGLRQKNLIIDQMDIKHIIFRGKDSCDTFIRQMYSDLADIIEYKDGKEKIDSKRAISYTNQITCFYYFKNNRTYYLTTQGQGGRDGTTRLWDQVTFMRNVEQRVNNESLNFKQISSYISQNFPSVLSLDKIDDIQGKQINIDLYFDFNSCFKKSAFL